MGYTWSCGDVLSLLGVRFNPDRAENIIHCPYCGGDRFAMNISKGTGHCFSPKCEKSADSVGYYAAAMNMSLQEAKNEIRSRLNLQDKMTDIPRFVFKEAPQSEIASVQERDRVYRAFLGKLYLNQKNRDNLLSRGFTEDDIAMKGYKTFPSASEVCFEDICRQLNSEGYNLRGIPGFFKNKNNQWSFVRVTKGIIIPQVNLHNMIEGLQIRKDDDLRINTSTGELEAKCCWFSSKGFPEGVGAKTSVHCAMDFIYNHESKGYEPVLHANKVTLTEGGMKADLVQSIMDSKLSCIAVQGVYALNPLKQTLQELKKFGLQKVNLAFDMDYLSNPNVHDAMEKTKELILGLDLGFDNVMNWNYKIEIDGKPIFLKGIDDYLAYEYKKVIPKVKE